MKCKKLTCVMSDADNLVDITHMETMSRHQKKDIRLIGRFVEVYCHGKHKDVQRTNRNAMDEDDIYTLCPDCSAFFEYAVMKRMKCPLEAEKPTCKHCRIHCYDKIRREKVKEIMSYAGRKLMMRGRLDYLWHYFF